MQTLKNHITEVFGTAPEVQNINQLCDDLQTAINDPRLRNDIALHVLALVSGSVKAHLHSQKALLAAMHTKGDNDHE